MPEIANNNFLRKKLSLTLQLGVLCGVLCSVLLLGGCAGAQPWERGQLAKYEMAFEPDPLEAKAKGHIYHSKEASSSGASASGGGCGCN